MTKCNNNTDFQTELLRINGTLQASITELRYHCEVYRLSLKSICKVLSNVHEDRTVRLRCLNTSRPSFQAYLLNLSQKHALDRIRNVVRKASTFINGYSLVDQRLFLPPPPNPSSITRHSGDSRRNISPSKEADASDNVIGGECISNCLDNPQETVEKVTEELSEHEEGEIISTENPKPKKAKHHSSSRSKDGKKKKNKTVSRGTSRLTRKSERSSRNHKYSSLRNSSKEMKRSDEEDKVRSKDDSREGRRTRPNIEKTVSGKFSRRNRTSRFDTASEAVKRSLERVRSKPITATTHRHYHELRSQNQMAINFREHATSNDENIKETVTKVGCSSVRLGGKQNSETLSRNKIPALFSIFTGNAKSVNSFVDRKSCEKSYNKFRGLDTRRERLPSREERNDPRQRRINNCSITKTERLNQANQNRSLSASGDRRGFRKTGQVATNARRQQLQDRRGTRPNGDGQESRRVHWERRGYSTYMNTIDKAKERLARVRNTRGNNNIFRQGQTLNRKYSFASSHERRKLNSRGTIKSNHLTDKIPEKVKRIQLFEN